jgi:putative peptidoglycan lipid II flippase
MSSFLKHAKTVGLLTLVSRLLGLLREMVSAHYLGTGLVASAFTVAFTIPNLFRKLFGEGALSAAFIPLYARAVKDDAEPEPHPESNPATESPQPLDYATPRHSSTDFAAASVNLLVAILLLIVLIGEGVLAAILFFADLRPDHRLTIHLTAIMLPYVLLICGTAFCSGILQVHRRFAASAAAPIILNVCHVCVLSIGAAILGLHASSESRDAAAGVQTILTYWLATFVLVAGILQVALLLPDLRAVGFRFRVAVGLWTPLTRRMLRLMIPVALGAGIVQLSVLLDRGLSTLLMQGVAADGSAITHFNFFGQSVRYPMEAGAPARLAIAQFLYLFPLGIFATALATAIFPSLSSDALEKDRTQFRSSLRQGLEAALWEGIPASVGLILVREPAIRLLFQHGQITPHDSDLIGQSLLFYAAGIWSFSMMQILTRGYYAIHDTVTPLYLSAINLVINCAVEIPLLWWLGEAGMAVGTLVAFAVQAILMAWMLDRKIGGLQLSSILPTIGKMLAATAAMALCCWGIQHSPIYPHGEARWIWASQLGLLMTTGAVIYLVLCRILNVEVMDQVLPRRFRRRGKTATPTIASGQAPDARTT